MVSVLLCFFFFNDTATTEIYTLSLHDALPICDGVLVRERRSHEVMRPLAGSGTGSTALAPHMFGRSEEHTSELQSQSTISYAVFCLKKKKRRHAGW